MPVPAPRGARSTDSLRASFTFTAVAASDGGSCTHVNGRLTAAWASIASGGTRAATLEVPIVAGNINITQVATQGALETNQATLAADGNPQLSGFDGAGQLYRTTLGYPHADPLVA